MLRPESTQNLISELVHSTEHSNSIDTVLKNNEQLGYYAIKAIKQAANASIDHAMNDNYADVFLSNLACYLIRASMEFAAVASEEDAIERVSTLGDDTNDSDHPLFTVKSLLKELGYKYAYEHVSESKDIALAELMSGSSAIAAIIKAETQNPSEIVKAVCIDQKASVRFALRAEIDQHRSANRQFGP
ncbi:TPA: hypothetical protein I7730_01180 [Vibrio vulnificus]|uniref:Uncharacterized protein n=1 Tax=Vibrio vulnificus TaxID=672 RepID=A0A8H9K776_VIBVL|nr:hypothetical protein [Vibrio vulnificus]